MTLYSHAFCVKLTNGCILLSGTYQLCLPSVFLPSEVHLFFKNQLKCSFPDYMPAHAKMSTTLTTAFTLEFPTREMRLIDYFFATFEKLINAIVILLF